MTRHIFTFLLGLFAIGSAYCEMPTCGEPEEPYVFEYCDKCKCCHLEGQHLGNDL